MVCTKKHKRENNTERKERRFRAVSVFVLFHASAFVFELFRFLFSKCVNALLFSPTRNKRREVEEREVCFENNNTHTERERESARARFWSVLCRRALLCSSFFCLPLRLVCFPHKTNWLTRQRDKNATIFITIGLVVGATIGRQINLGNSQRRRRKRRGTFDDDEREEYDDKQRQRWRQMGESEEEEKESNERL